MEIPNRKSVVLTHFGRKSGKPYDVEIWYVVRNGRVMVGSLDGSKSWVRNVASSGKCRLNFGDGASDFTAVECLDAAEGDAFRADVRAKHPIMSRFVRWQNPNPTPRCFVLEPA